LLALVAAPIAVVLGSMLAEHYYYGSLIRSPPQSKPAEETVLSMGTSPTERTTASGTPTDVTVTEETIVLQGKSERKGPPDSTLSYSGREVRGTVGTYSWGGMVADSFGIVVPPKKQTLTVPSGSELVFRYGSQRPPKQVGAAAYPARHPLRTGVAFPQELGSGRSLDIHGSGTERIIPAELQSGEYVVYVPVTEPRGQIDFTFRVMVQ
jgi:hypothetical protein